MTYLIANWSAPKHIKALTTTRLSGWSEGPYAKNNLAMHVDDTPSLVTKNRQALREQLQLSHEPIWLEQTHSTHCVRVENANVDRRADAASTSSRAFPLAIMTADCLPIVLCNQTGTEIAAIHAGWRGLVGGIIENTLKTMQSSPETCLAWIGPAICGRCYETGEEVFAQFKENYQDAEKAFFYQQQRLHANLAKMAELILINAGIQSVTQSNACTFESNDKYYSYRKSAQTGRIVTLIWFEDRYHEHQTHSFNDPSVV